MVFKNLTKHLLFILIGLFFSADIVFYYYPILNFIAIIFLLTIVVYKISFLDQSTQFNLLALYLIYVIFFVLIHSSTLSYIVVLKYILLGIFIIVPLKKISYNNQVFFSRSINYLFNMLLIIGFLQFIILNLSFGYVQFEGHSRPIGLSTEPTWYSQQLVVLFIVSKYLNNKFQIKNSFISDLLFFALILVTFTRTSILVLLFWYLYNKNFLKIFYGFLLFTLIIWISSDTEFIKPIISKLLNQSNISSEPRVLAFYESIDLIKQSNILIGEGFRSFIGPLSGLTLGSYYAVLPIAFLYTFGISSFIPFLLILFSYLINRSKLSKIIILISLFFSLFMPYLLTVFSFLILFISKTFVNDKS